MAHDVRNPHIFVDGPGNTASGDQVMDNFDALWTAGDATQASWQNIAWGGALVQSGTVAGTYLLFGGGNAAGGNPAIATNSTGSGSVAFPLDPADWAVSGKTTKLRVRAQVVTNSVAPAVNFTVGLYPVGGFGGTGPASPTIPSLGTVVCSVLFTTPGAAAGIQAAGTEVNAPAANFYVFGVLLSGTTAANSAEYIHVALQRRWI